MLSIRGDLSRIEEIIFLTPEHISGDLCQFCKCYIFRTSGFAKLLNLEEVNAEIQRIVDDMFETMYAEEGIGLAATQVDIHQRIIVIDVSENRDERLVLINPELLEKAAKQALKKVACRSLNNVL